MKAYRVGYADCLMYSSNRIFFHKGGQTNMAKIVAVPSCPTGIAHTFMAAEALRRGAEGVGHKMKVETQGSVGSQNTLTEADIRGADQVIIAADTKVDMSRFQGKPIYETSTNAAIKDGQAVVKNALAQAPAQAPAQITASDDKTDHPNVVATNSCPSRTAHTLMLAGAPQKVAAVLGHRLEQRIMWPRCRPPKRHRPGRAEAPTSIC